MQQQIAENNPSAGNFQHARIKISDRMIARLSADPDDFSIDPAGVQEQAVGMAAPVVWSWRITLNHWGRHRLRLVLEALVTVDGGAVPARLTTLDKPMLVTVTPLGRVRRSGDGCRLPCVPPCGLSSSDGARPFRIACGWRKRDRNKLLH
ncbi:hypothetical protein BW21_5716 [Burkholderia humptydooensis]|nr:hypothetical protein BW21_5716 [Burkholderia sp. 2002721687]